MRIRTFLSFCAVATMFAWLAGHAGAEPPYMVRKQHAQVTFWESRSNARTYRPARRYRSYDQGASYVQPSTDAQRRFSYEPAPFHPGDKVVVTADNAQMKIGKEVVGVARKGAAFVVGQVERGWLWATVEVDGKPVKGWIRHRLVRPDSQSS